MERNYDIKYQQKNRCAKLLFRLVSSQDQRGIFICKKLDECTSGKQDRIVARGGGLHGILDEKSGKYAGKIRSP